MFLQKTVIAPRSSFCGSHTGMYLFDALGDIYTCWEWAGFPAMRVGRLDFETGEMFLQDKQLERWRSRTVANVPTCRKCQYALYCGGGCAAHATAQTGKFMNSHCNSFPAVFQHGVRSAFTEYQEYRQRVAAGETVEGNLAASSNDMLCS
jgi:uncharacterized protein